MGIAALNPSYLLAVHACSPFRFECTLLQYKHALLENKRSLFQHECGEHVHDCRRMHLGEAKNDISFFLLHVRWGKDDILFSLMHVKLGKKEFERVFAEHAIGRIDMH